MQKVSKSNKVKLLEEELIQTLAQEGKLQLKLTYWEELIKKAETELGIDLKKVPACDFVLFLFLLQ